jgi:hypothetical protein
VALQPQLVSRSGRRTRTGNPPLRVPRNRPGRAAGIARLAAGTATVRGPAVDRGPAPDGLPRVAYLVLTHRDIASVERLVRTLVALDPHGVVVVHHDGTNVPLDPARLLTIPRVHVIEDWLACGWGEAEHLPAVLRALRWIDRHVDPDWTVLVSGQCHPVRPLRELREHFATVDADACIAGSSCNDPERPSVHRYFRRRYTYRHVPVPMALWRRVERSPRLRAAVDRTLRVVGRFHEPVYLQERPRGMTPLLGFRTWRRPFSAEAPCWKGYDWFAVGRRATASLLRRSASDPGLVRFFARTFIPSEAFYVTVLANDPGVRIADEVHFMRFSGSHPITLTRAELDDIRASGRWLARKFDADSAELLADLEAELGVPQEVR